MLKRALRTGTFAYASPEAIMGNKLTLKSDIYSFGIVLLEVCIGRGHSTPYALPSFCDPDPSTGALHSLDCLQHRCVIPVTLACMALRHKTASVIAAMCCN